MTASPGQRNDERLAPSLLHLRPLGGMEREAAMALASRPESGLGSSTNLLLERGARPERGAQLLRRWRRSSELGADPDGDSSSTMEAIASPARLQEAREHLEVIQRGADALLSGFARRCESANHVAVLTDERGVIAHVAGGGSFALEAKQRRLIEGAIWSESLRGTNAIGTALAEECPVLVEGEAHFARANGQLACIAAPIRDPSGRVLGVLDATAPSACLGSLQSSLLIDVVRAIEDLVRLRAYGAGASASQRLRLVERLMERARGPAFLVERPGRIVRRNQQARSLEQELGEAARLPGFDELLELASGHGTPLWSPRQHQGLEPRWRIEVEPVAGVDGSATGIVVFLEPGIRRAPAMDPVPSPHHSNRSSPPVVPRSADKPDPFSELIGDDSSFCAAVQTARTLAASLLPVLLIAETGTGKELFARGIHAASPRSAAPLVALNCGALHRDLLLAELFGHAAGAYTGAPRSGRDGAIAAASGGTLFLDEIADLPEEGQAALLRVLEAGTYRRIGESFERRADLRVVAATSRDLTQLVESGVFRADLFYRLGGAPVSIPPLRERSDVLLLARSLWSRIQEAASLKAALEGPALEALLTHPWPGNVRELRSALAYAATMASDAASVRLEHLPPSISPGTRATPAPSASAVCTDVADEERVSPMDRARYEAFVRALRDADGNVSAAARALGVARSTVYRLAKRWGINL